MTHEEAKRNWSDVRYMEIHARLQERQGNEGIAAALRNVARMAQAHLNSISVTAMDMAPPMLRQISGGLELPRKVFQVSIEVNERLILLADSVLLAQMLGIRVAPGDLVHFRCSTSEEGIDEVGLAAEFYPTMGRG